MFKADEIRTELASDLRHMKRITRRTHITFKQVKPLSGMTSDAPAPIRSSHFARPVPANTGRVWSF